MDVNLVTVGVSVTDRKSRAIKGLVAKDFEIYEHEKLQRTSFFSAEEQPNSLALLLNKNCRMKASGKLEEAKRALLALVDANHADTEISYLTYDRKAISRYSNSGSRCAAIGLGPRLPSTGVLACS
ncbi:MAG: hypothetical protein L0387_40310 [Acidobacteria bacterium]|nr:hypothetical protein [Acidobacteriota bacterium]MCI0627833.1 hypothetical protein [Acidobacteriota bacterium]MCI0721236.1 hypothetical protein [Acidobacteriota bacterium]